MSTLVSQFSPYSCALDCWTHYMRECGNHVVTEEVLRHHRDICSNQPPQEHAYGAIDFQRFKILAARYLKHAADFAPQDAIEVDDRIKRGDGVFVFASNYRGNNHAMRAVAVVGREIEFLIPAFPYGLRERVTFDHVLKSWNGSFIEVR